MKLTDDEHTTSIEALREYRLRVPYGSGRQVICDALIFRHQRAILDNIIANTKGTPNEPADAD